MQQMYFYYQIPIAMPLSNARLNPSYGEMSW